MTRSGSLPGGRSGQAHFKVIKKDGKIYKNTLLTSLDDKKARKGL